jgi:hypothetical protein
VIWAPRPDGFRRMDFMVAATVDRLVKMEDRRSEHMNRT